MQKASASCLVIEGNYFDERIANCIWDVSTFFSETAVEMCFFFFFWSSSQFKKLSLKLFKIVTGILVNYYFCCCCCYSVAQLCSTLYDPVDCNTPGFPVHHQLPEFSQTYVHWLGDAIQPSYPLLALLTCLQSFPASGSFSQWVGSLNQMAKVLELQLQHQSFQWIFSVDFI